MTHPDAPPTVEWSADSNDYVYELIALAPDHAEIEWSDEDDLSGAKCPPYVYTGDLEIWFTGIPSDHKPPPTFTATHCAYAGDDFHPAHWSDVTWTAERIRGWKDGAALYLFIASN